MPSRCAPCNLVDELFFNRKSTILIANVLFLIMLWCKLLIRSKLSNVSGKAFVKNNFEVKSKKGMFSDGSENILFVNKIKI